MLKLTKTKSKLMIALAIAGVVVVVFLVVLRARNAPVSDPGAGNPAIAVATIEVDPGRYWDYQLGDSKLALTLQPLLTTPLIEIKYNKAIKILVKDIEYKDDYSDLHLRQRIYWSDGKLLSGQHIVDALDRWRLSFAILGKKPKDDEESHWLVDLELSAIGKYIVRAKGFHDAADFEKFLSQDFMRPVRGDLLGKSYPGNDDAWLASLGPYKLSRIVAGKLSVPGTFELVPNELFYRGPLKEPQKIQLEEVFTN